MQYVALLRGINVGGNNMIKMAELMVCLEKAGLANVKTYIQSGNIIFNSKQSDMVKLAKLIKQAIKKQFGFDIATLVVSGEQLQEVAKNIPKGWGEKSDWRYYIFFLLPGCTPQEVIDAIGPLKPQIETLTAGPGVVYQSMSMGQYGKTTTGKLPSKAIYQQITIRNLNTTRKLAALCAETA